MIAVDDRHDTFESVAGWILTSSREPDELYPRSALWNHKVLLFITDVYVCEVFGYY